MYTDYKKRNIYATKELAIVGSRRNALQELVDRIAYPFIADSVAQLDVADVTFREVEEYIECYHKNCDTIYHVILEQESLS